MTNYFSHDSNARNDERILRLRRDLGARGYGIYWMLLERMREEEDYSCSTDYDTLSFDLREKAELIRKVATGYELFQFSNDGKKFYSSSFLARMREKDSVSEKRRSAANKRWQNADNHDECETPSDANAMQMQCKCNARAESVHAPSPHPSPKSKEKESKDNNPPLPPQGGVGEEEGSSYLHPTKDSKFSTWDKVHEIDVSFARHGLPDDYANWFLRYTNLCEYDYGYIIPNTKEEVDRIITICQNLKIPEAPYATIEAVRSLGKLVPNADDQELIIDTFRTGTLANRKKNADIVLGIINTIERKRGSADEVRMPASFIKKCLNI